MFIDYKRYSSFEVLNKEFFAILTALISNYSQIRINRVGLRYIDKILLPGTKLSNKSWHSYWSKYISEYLIRGLSFPDDCSKISRHLNSIEMNYGGYQLRFQYGIFNEDYPAPNKKNGFILDTDVYSVGLLEIEDIKSDIDMFHQRAVEWFEKAIKKPLKEIMNEKKS